MRRYPRFLSLFILSVLFVLLLPLPVSANAAEPPSLTIIVANAPDDLTLSLLWENQSASATQLIEEDRVLEQYYRFYHHQIPSIDTSNAILLVSWDGYQFELPLSQSQLEGYSNLMTLDLETQTLTSGEAPLRTAFYVAMRVVLTLMIEGAIFFLFGFRERASWMAFLLINLITQSCLNLCLTGPDLGRTYWGMLFILLEVVVLATELIALPRFIGERKPSTIRLYALIANLSSLLAGGYFIANLPV